MAPWLEDIKRRSERRSYWDNRKGRGSKRREPSAWIARVEEFEINTVPVQKWNIQRRANEERQQLQKYRSQDLAKAILPSLDNLWTCSAVEGLTDDVKKAWNGVRNIYVLKEEGLKEIQADGDLTTTSLRLFKQCLQMRNIQQIRLHKPKRYNSTNASLRPACGSIPLKICPKMTENYEWKIELK